MVINDSENYYLFLRVAGINLGLNIQQKQDFLFLKRKYVDYLSKVDKETYYIDIIFGKKLRREPFSRKSNRLFIFNTIFLQNNFAYFNDIFLQIFIIILNERNGFLVHASTLCYKNKGYVFMGKEGAGKSTIRKICKSIESLSDDIAILKRVKNNYYLYGSPFYQRTKRSYPNKKVLIKGIFNLTQKKYTRIEKLSKFDSFVVLRNNTFFTEASLTQNELINNFLNKVEIFQLDFEKNNEFWKIVSGSDFIFLYKNNFEKFLININEGLSITPEQYQWKSLIANQNFVNHLNVVNDLSWNFEFGDNKTIKLIAKRVCNLRFSGSHTELIRKYLKSKHFNSLVIICLKNNNKFEIIDGNHRVIANTIAKKNCYYKLIYANSQNI
ncbi:hypothetical protein CO165_02785 [Candidatus Roizmanbacteria bacterium CG_4_9_14_3_um_filter_33_18]|uniref:Uncharacterized protein n=1 Tax=Candidatus Roizmanbacteria bacterium CG_4_9_14_3_um_filter_33_18 TaxID=1974841 RepID=A0A2M7XXX0_9BACT|nr:MAG: hypothetical protein CO165_02785 [Candidatus Roizmanbacteria bacterium CG_4_9_14_3_um_filter_33_18]